MLPMTDEHYMRIALTLAEATVGQTGTNPAVGCVIVSAGRIVGIGAHLRQGQAHAEVHALQMAGEDAQGGTLYVTLEPCHHYGRTPPCTHAICAAGIERVVVASIDPNEAVNGKGIAFLRAQSIAVTVGVLEAEAQQINEVFWHLMRTRRPFVAVKTAMTLDGYIATPAGHSQWITRDTSRQFGRSLRQRYAAIVVGIGTVLADNPRLTTRGDVVGRDPLRIVVDSMLRLPPTAALIQPRADDWPAALVFTTERAPMVAERRLRARGVEVIRTGEDSRVNLYRMLDALYDLQIDSLFVEGGGTLAGAMLQHKLVQKLYAFIAPRLMGVGGVPAFSLEAPLKLEHMIAFQGVTVQQLDEDVLFTAYIKETP
jgi:diaminohydroxyphosphoribosylaminopyrimidine deaminase/5-amino-6-(5-phosphoribosylamino)uracil reductase